MSKEEKKRVRRTHTRELKAEAVKLVRSGGRNVSQVARELGLSDTLVRTWVVQVEVDAGRGPASALTVYAAVRPLLVVALSCACLLCLAASWAALDSKEGELVPGRSADQPRNLRQACVALALVVVLYHGVRAKQ